jgi:hypothetical protein
MMMMMMMMFTTRIEGDVSHVRGKKESRMQKRKKRRG